MEPPPPPPRETDSRPIRVRRPFSIAGELGWNGLTGLGAIFSYHPIPYLAFDAGLGLSITGGRIGIRARYNILTGEWTPFVGVGMSYAGGSADQHPELDVKSEKVKLDVLPSPFLQLAGGVNYTGTEGFVFTATTGYSLLLERPNTRFYEDADHPKTQAKLDAYNEAKQIYQGGLIASVAFGYAF